jgi:hypothetical protein
LIDTTVTKPELTRRTYEELFSEKLLSLAVALRTRFYQGAPNKGSEPFVGHSAFLLVSTREEIRPFTIKDVCDKLIHAKSITRPINDGTAQPVTQVRGTHQGDPWILHISTGLFCEGILNWIESIDSGDKVESAV